MRSFSASSSRNDKFSLSDFAYSEVMYFGQMSVRSHRFQMRDAKSAEAVNAVIIEPFIQPTTA